MTNMRLSIVTVGLAFGTVAVIAAAQGSGTTQQAAQAPAAPDPVQILVDRLTLESYKATLKGLTQFGDRREGTQRNRDAVAWIEAQLKSYGCQTERMTYEVAARGGGAGGAGNRGGGAAGAGAAGAGAAGAAGAGAGAAGAAGGAGRAGAGAAGAAAGGGGAAGAGAAGGGGGQGRGTTVGPLAQPVRSTGTQNGGATLYGNRGRTGVNNNPEAQPNEALRTLNSGPVLPDPIPQVFCTKWGTTRRGEMYILGAHMDGIGWGEAANDDGSGTALIMELARIFSMPDVTTDVTIRFALWNGEEGGTARRERLRRPARKARRASRTSRNGSA